MGESRHSVSVSHADEAVPFDSRQLRDACGQFGTGVTIVTTHHDGHDHGMTANAFMSISLSPPLIAVSIAEKARMLPKIQATGRFAVSVLAGGMEDVAWHFAGKPKPGMAACLARRDDLPVVTDAVAVFTADVVDEIVAGDHTVFIGRVRTLTTDVSKRPLFFHGGRFGALADPHAAPPILENVDYGVIW